MAALNINGLRFFKNKTHDLLFHITTLVCSLTLSHLELCLTSVVWTFDASKQMLPWN